MVTNPGFVHERGDRYLIEVDADDLPHLYPCRSLIEAGIPVGGSTDAPFGHPDPWRDIAAAIERRTAGGEPLGVREAVSPERALALFLTRPEAPGRRARRVAVGAPADLVVLDGPLSQVLEDPSSQPRRGHGHRRRCRHGLTREAPAVSSPGGRCPTSTAGAAPSCRACRAG